MEVPLPALGCAVLVPLAAFVSLMRSGLDLARLPRLKALAGRGNGGAERALALRENAGPPLASLKAALVFLEALLALLAGAAFAAPLAAALASLRVPLAGPLALALIALALFLVIFFLIETLPRYIAAANPERLTAALAIPLIVCRALAFPAAAMLEGFSSLLKKIFPPGASPDPGMDDLRTALEEGEKSGIVESEERTMVEGVFYLGDRPVENFMTHRPEVRWLDTGAGPDEARAAVEALGEGGFFPVANGNLDKVTGAVSSTDILLALLRGDWPGLKALMKAPYLIPETMTALKAFEAFKKAGADYLFVMDEYGGFSGILTLRDLIEEIVGGLPSPASGESAIVRKRDGVWLADGSVSIDDAAEALSLESLAGVSGARTEYHTLAGFILELAGEIPPTGAEFEAAGCRFRITRRDGNRIDKVLITRLESGEGEKDKK